jgi:hypothetical protein
MCRSTNAMNAEHTMILSANGSISTPKLVISFRRRAISPSRKSVRPARQKNINASVSLTGERENIAHRNSAVSRKREGSQFIGQIHGRKRRLPVAGCHWQVSNVRLSAGSRPLR